MVRVASGSTGEMRGLRLFLAGDVMTGRGIDQILPHRSDPVLHEGYVQSAEDYVTLAERLCGPIPRDVAPDYIWGHLLEDLAALEPDLRIINLETAVTTSGRAEPKGINYRMHPGNVGILGAAKIDACTLANNHVLDWGIGGLRETLDVLDGAGIGLAGAGRNATQAEAPLVLDAAGRGRVIVLAYGAKSSGVPANWAAAADRPGVNLLPRAVPDAVAAVRAALEPVRRPGDFVLYTVHWGPNWGYEVATEQQELAKALITEGLADAIVGHSSHHPKRIEVIDGKLVLYGCGDLINDYEGIGGYEEYRGELGLGYVAEFGAEGRLRTLDMLPYRRRAFRLERAEGRDRDWLEALVRRETVAPGMLVSLTGEGALRLAPLPGGAAPMR